ncbi:MAG: hypothetical protein LAO51_04365 [Acidobacteriia bacterium]|nr:hypothetical protein [Terriglobia bacterium]
MTALAVGVLVAPGVLRAEPPPTGTAPEESVPLYTNADLLKFGPPSGPDEAVRTRDEGEWEFVQAFLDREYARVDAERDYEIERSVTEGLLHPAVSSCPRYVAPYRGVYGFPGVMPFRYPRSEAWPPFAALGTRGVRPSERGMAARPQASVRPGPSRSGAARPGPSGS